MVLSNPTKNNGAILLSMIASHIDSEKKCQHFIDLLNSVHKQENYFQAIRLHISLSHDKNISPDNLQKIYGVCKNNNYKIFVQNKKLSQFEHYAFLFDQLNSKIKNNLSFYPEIESNIWILLCDDKIFWQQNRLSTYQTIIEKLSHQKYSNVKSFSCVNGSQSESINDYTNYCARLVYCNMFFRHIGKEHIKHKYCGWYFINFLRKYRPDNLLHLDFRTPKDLYDWINHLN